MRILFCAALLGLLTIQTGPSLQVTDGVIEVTVRDASTRAPIPGARITFIKQETTPPNVVAYITADENGRASFRNLVSGSYTMNVQKTGYIPPSLGGAPIRVIGPDSRRFDVELILTKGTTVSGRVTDVNGQPVAEVRVALMTIAYRDALPTLVIGTNAGVESTDDRGNYRFLSVPPGNYYVQVEMRPGATVYSQYWDSFPMHTYYPGVTDPKGAVLVQVRASQDIAGIDIRISTTRTFKIRGTVVNPFSGGRATANGETNRQVSSFFLVSSDPDTLEDAILLFSRQFPSPNPAETLFEIPNVAPGSYYLYPYWDPGRSATMAFGGYTRRTPVQIEDHDVDGLQIVLRENSEIKGRIRVEDNTSLADWSKARISMRRKERLPSLLGGGGLGSVPSPISASGEFTLSNVPDARFNVFLIGSPPDAYVVDVRQNGRNVSNEGVVPGAGDLEVIVNPQGATLQGTVRDAAGMPVRSGVVLVPAPARRSNPQLYKRTTTDANGQFTIRGVAPGDYKIFAFSAMPQNQAEENAQFIATYESRGTAVSTGMSATIQLMVIPLQ